VYSTVWFTKYILIVEFHELFTQILYSQVSVDTYIYAKNYRIL